MSNSARLIEGIIPIASRLIAVLEKEVELLRAMKPRDVAGLQEEKETLIVAYEEKMRSLTASPDAVEGITPVLQEEFRTLATRFDAAMKENRLALNAASAAQRRFLDAVVRAADEKRTTYRGYSADGALPAAGQGAPSTMGPLSLTLDRQF